jgi:hypothetical protein
MHAAAARVEAAAAEAALGAGIDRGGEQRHAGAGAEEKSGVSHHGFSTLSSLASWILLAPLAGLKAKLAGVNFASVSQLSSAS